MFLPFLFLLRLSGCIKYTSTTFLIFIIFINLFALNPTFQGALQEKGIHIKTHLTLVQQASLIDYMLHLSLFRCVQIYLVFGQDFQDRPQF